MTNEEQKSVATGIQDILWMAINDEVVERLYKLIDETNLDAAMININIEYVAERRLFELGGSQ